MKVLNQRDLPGDRLSTTDEKGRRVYIFPAKVNGIFRKYRTLTQIVLILILLVLPWIKINSNQAFLIDIFERKLHLFGLTFWAHDAPYVFFLLAILTIGLAFITAVWGRIWCGWGCPQTVFIDGIFRRVEYLIIGSEIKQRNLAKSPYNREKIFKYSFIWVIFGIISFIISNSFLAYFVGAERLIQIVQSSPLEHWTMFVVVLFTAAFLLFDFGWFREQFCIIMCPYGRFQSVLMDDDSLTISYDYNRGEPRKNIAKTPEEEGDCIDCYRCVAVCPTGIDIRNGMQLECIACTACIDACDEIMEKVNKPKGLIRYDTNKGINGQKSKLLRNRTIIYLLLLAVIIAGFTFLISKKEDYLITILRAKDQPYSSIINEEGTKEIINHFKIHLKNQTATDSNIIIDLPENIKKEGVSLITQNKNLFISSGRDLTIHFFIKFPEKYLGDRGQRIINIDFIKTDEHLLLNQKEVNLVGPKSGVY